MKRSLKLKYHDLIIRRRKDALIEEKRQNRNTNANGLHLWFQEQVRDGPKYVCTVCHKFKFKKQVITCNDETYLKKGGKSFSMANLCKTRKYCMDCTDECGKYCTNITHKLWICYTFRRHLLKGEMPADAYINCLQLPEIQKDLKSLNRLERQLVSLRISFMKLVQVPKEDKRASLVPMYQFPLILKKQQMCFPEVMMRQVIRCKLKRRPEYKGHSQYEFVSTKRICKAIEQLQANNPLYQCDISVNQAWVDSNHDQNCTSSTEIESDSSEVRNDTDMAEIETDAPEAENNTDEFEIDEDELIHNKGLPSDTCLQPADIGQEVLDQHFEDIFCVALGKAKTPVGMLTEERNKAMSFPVQFPKGVIGTYDTKRKVRITRSRYNTDSRFFSDNSYIFYAQYLSELE